MNRRGKKREEDMPAAWGPSFLLRIENRGAVRRGIALGQVPNGRVRGSEEGSFKSGAAIYKLGVSLRERGKYWGCFYCT